MTTRPRKLFRWRLSNRIERAYGLSMAGSVRTIGLVKPCNLGPHVKGRGYEWWAIPYFGGRVSLICETCEAAKAHLEQEALAHFLGNLP